MSLFASTTSRVSTVKSSPSPTTHLETLSPFSFSSRVHSSPLSSIGMPSLASPLISRKMQEDNARLHFRRKNSSQESPFTGRKRDRVSELRGEIRNSPQNSIFGCSFSSHEFDESDDEPAATQDIFLETPPVNHSDDEDSCPPTQIAPQSPVGFQTDDTNSHRILVPGTPYSEPNEYGVCTSLDENSNIPKHAVDFEYDEALCDQTELEQNARTVSEKEQRFKLAQCVFAAKNRIQNQNVARGIGFEEQMEQLQQMFSGVVESGQSGSLLLIGGRGSGKRFLVDKLLQSYHLNHSINKPVVLVRLCGLLQTDDNMALKEITRQLCLMDSENVQAKRNTRGTFSQHLNFLLSVLRMGTATGTAIVFILENFEIFVQRQKQTLLYNLLDLTQTQNSILVLGCTERLDIVERMEKRIKSRFSNHLVYLPNPTLGDLQDIILERLKLPEPVLEDWNIRIRELVTENKQCKTLLERQLHSGFTVDWFLSLFTCALSRLSFRNRKHPYLEFSDVLAAKQNLVTDFTLEAVLGLSSIELTLLIAMVQLENIQNFKAYNFEMVYNQVKEKYFKMQGNPDINFSKNVAHKAFEHLLHAKLIAFSATNLGDDNVHSLQVISGQGRINVPQQYKPVRMLMDSDELLTLIRQSDSNTLPCSTSLQHWASKSVAV